jgi:mRNA-degrading endonuclease RelE of RelBE toxin-antitoxin system
LAPEVFEDFDRFTEHMALFKVWNPAARIRQIIQAIQVLRHSPLRGRLVGGEDREFVIRLRSHNYVALYRFDTSADTVFILAIRSESEEGYKRGR